MTGKHSHVRPWASFGTLSCLVEASQILDTGPRSTSPAFPPVQGRISYLFSSLLHGTDRRQDLSLPCWSCVMTNKPNVTVPGRLSSFCPYQMCHLHLFQPLFIQDNHAPLQPVLSDTVCIYKLRFKLRYHWKLFLPCQLVHNCLISSFSLLQTSSAINQSSILPCLLACMHIYASTWVGAIGVHMKEKYHVIGLMFYLHVS